MQIVNPLTIFRADKRYLKFQIDVACLSTDAVGNFVCIRGDRVGERYRVHRADCGELSRMPVFGLLISKKTPTVGKVQIYGPIIGMFIDLVPGMVYVLDRNGITFHLPVIGPNGYAVRQIVGHAIANDVLFLNPNLSITVHRGQ